MEFVKIKYSEKKLETHLEWTTASEKDQIEHKLVSHDPPAKEFPASLQALVPEIVRLLELPEDYAEGLTVVGLSISRNDTHGRGVVITSLKELTGTTNPLVPNTPYMPEMAEDGPTMSAQLVQLVNAVEVAAERYVKGIRQQRDLFEVA